VRDLINEWKQHGAVYVWRYRRPNRARSGWHFSANLPGGRSLCQLLDRMKGGDGCYRTLKLGSVTENIWNVPNFGQPKNDAFTSMRVEFCPDFDDLELQEVDGRLVLKLGNNRIEMLRAAFAEVEIGKGDFGISTSDRRNPEIWMFWWN